MADRKIGECESSVLLGFWEYNPFWLCGHFKWVHDDGDIDCESYLPAVQWRPDHACPIVTLWNSSVYDVGRRLLEQKLGILRRRAALGLGKRDEL